MGTKRIKLVWTQHALADVREIREYIAADNRFQANRVFQAIRKKPNILKDFPEIGAVVQDIGKNDIRSVHCFSWRILYKYIKEERTVHIISVFHSARELTAEITDEILTNTGLSRKEQSNEK